MYDTTIKTIMESVIEGTSPIEDIDDGGTFGPVTEEDLWSGIDEDNHSPDFDFTW